VIVVWVRDDLPAVGHRRYLACLLSFGSQLGDCLKCKKYYLPEGVYAFLTYCHLHEWRLPQSMSSKLRTRVVRLKSIWIIYSRVGARSRS